MSLTVANSAQQVNQRPPSSQVLHEPPSVNNNDGAGGGDSAAVAMQQLDHVKMEEDNYNPSESGPEEQYKVGRC